MTDVSIVIRTRNEGRSLEKVLRIISNQDTELDYEIILVDSYSTDNTKYLAKKYDCKIINLSPLEFSWGRALNIGIENSNSEFCILLSAHCYPANDKWMTHLVKPLIEDEKVAASYGGQLPIRGYDPFEELELKMWFPTNSRKRIGISNSNACIRKEVWKKFKFNESLSSYEDGEWAMRVRNAGYELRYVPEAAVYHSHKLNFENVYRRWYWRARMGVNVSRNKEKIKIAAKFPSPLLLALSISVVSYFIWLIKDMIYCMKNKYFNYICLAPFYEFIRKYAFFLGAYHGLKDIRNGNIHNSYTYHRKVNLPDFMIYVINLSNRICKSL